MGFVYKEGDMVKKRSWFFFVWFVLSFVEKKKKPSVVCRVDVGKILS